ncbi:MAG TPA: NAD(P)-dependent oxidoreductase [Acidimicrobiales bacterium]
MTTDKPKLAVLGLGTMGTAIAQTAHRAGLPLVVWNRNPAATEVFKGTDVEVAPSVADAAAGADVVVTMVTNADAVRSIATEQGLIEALRPQAVWAQMSTIGLEGTMELATLVAVKRPEALFVDAPVSGSKVPAENGTLLVFASGPDAARPLVDPVFSAIGQRTIWLGAVGNGSRMKLVNNVLLAFTAEGVANSLGLAHRLGLPIAGVVDAFDGGPLISPWESGKLRRIQNDDYSAEFALELALKDVHLALAEGGADQFKVLGALAAEWDEIAGRGLGPRDVTVVTQALGG